MARDRAGAQERDRWQVRDPLIAEPEAYWVPVRALAAALIVIVLLDLLVIAERAITSGAEGAGDTEIGQQNRPDLIVTTTTGVGTTVAVTVTSVATSAPTTTVVRGPSRRQPPTVSTTTAAPSPTTSAPAPVGMDPGVHLLRLGAKETTRFLAAPGGVSSISWSPEGADIGYRSGQDLGVAGRSGDRVLGSGLDATTDITWHPDGRRIAIIRDGDVELIDAQGGGTQRFSTGGSETAVDVASPSGRLVAIGSDGVTTFAESGGPRRISTEAFGPGQVRWSPDGTRVVAISPASGARVLVNADGSERRRLAPDLADPVSTVDWSPSARLLLISVLEPGGPSLYVTPAGVGPSTRLGTGVDLGRWSPREDRIAARRRRAGGTDVVLMNPDGTGLVVVASTDSSRDVSSLAWTANGTLAIGVTPSG